LEAFASVTANFPDWRLTIIGDGPLRSVVEAKVAQLGLWNKVTLTGFVESPLELIAGAEIYAHISLQEGLPLAVLDAMGLGTAVLATDIGGIPEVIRHLQTGYLAAPEKEAVEGGLRELMRDEGLRRQLVETARGHVMTDLTWEKTAAHYLRLALQEAR
jgi:glycosyltransferase involved in cell wall biosynthesis